MGWEKDSSRGGCRPVFLLAGLLLPCISLQAAQEAQDAGFSEVVAQARQIFQQTLNDQELVGGIIALVYQNGQRWSHGAGLASRDRNVPFDENTSNALHELAKLFTALAVMQLVERELIELDAPYSRYVHDFSPNTEAVGKGEFTIRQLLSHHSGLPTQYAPGFRLSVDQSGSETQAWDTRYRDVIDRSHELALIAAPGQVYEYSYLGYTLLGILIEKVTGLDYREYVWGNILAPLGMNHTHFGGAGQASTSFSAAFRRGREESQRLFRDLPANGLVSTAYDMSLFLQAIVTGGAGIIEAATLAEMFSVQNAGTVEDANFRIGLGFFISPVTGGPFQHTASISHAADVGKSQAYFIALPQYQLALMLSTNTTVRSTRVREAADRIMGMMLDAARGESLTAYTRHTAVDMDPGRARVLEGVYSGVNGLYRVELKGDSLKLAVPAYPFFNITLQPREDDFYGLSIRLFGFLRLRAFNFIEELERSLEMRAVTIDQANYLYWYWRGVAALTFSELPPVEQNAAYAAWLQRTRDYASGLSDEVFTLGVDKDTQHLLFGVERGMFDLSQPPQIYCVVNATVLRRCGRGLEPPETRNVLWMSEEGLRDAYGRLYSPLP